jgi:hypothetical protein
MIRLNDIRGEYQDIEINGSVVKKGKRECVNRWEMIKKHIKPNCSIIDVGSFHGYFGIKICREIENTSVLSIESNPGWAEEQKLIVESNGLTNLAVSNHTFSLNDLKWMERVTDGIDYVIMLAVLEYFPKNEIEDILYYISKITPNFIIEFPEKTETKAGGIDIISKYSPFESYLKKYFNKVETIGEPIATTDPSLKRKMYLATNDSLERTKLYSSKDHIKSREHTLLYEKEKWSIKEFSSQNKEWISGFNLHNLLKFNIVYPRKEWFIDKAYEEYLEIFNKHKNISDISLKNLLFCSSGLKAIDYLETKKVDNLDKFEEEFTRFITREINK